MGRYTFNLLREFMQLRPDHEYTLVGHTGLGPLGPKDIVALPSRVVYLPFGDQSERNRMLLAEFINTSGAELYVECSPFESESLYGVAVPNVAGLVRARTCAILYDVIPAVFPDHYLPNSASKKTYAEKLKLTTDVDFLLSISASSRLDLVRHFAVSPRVIGCIGGGVDAFFYEDEHPEAHNLFPTRIAELLSSRCIFYLGGGDWRKNEGNLIEAYSLLPEHLRERHPLVFAHTPVPEIRQIFSAHAGKLGVGDRLHQVGYIDDLDLKRLYEHCHLFVFPSRYEGYGLPIAEAMVCGAPVLASGTSSMPEVCGDAAMLIENPDDPEEIARKMQRILQDEDLRQDLKHRSIGRREVFRWGHVAARMDRHLRTWMGESVAGTSRSSEPVFTPSSRPRIAVFSPLPPIPSGISDYIADLLPHLREQFEIDLFIDDGYTPTRSDPRLEGCQIFNHREFPEIAEARHYHVINHQLGSSVFHIYQLEWILKYPSVVMLHDPTLAGLIWMNEGIKPRHFKDINLDVLLRNEVGEHRGRKVFQDLRSGQYDVNTLVEKGIYVNEFIFRYANAVMMQTTGTVEHFARRPASVDSAKVYYAPQPIPLPDESVNGVSFRDKLGIPADATLVSSFGVMAALKQPLPLLHACRRVREKGRNVHLAFVGSDEHAPEVRRRVEELDLGGWVHFCGHVPMGEFYEGLHASDIVACLRFPCQEQLSAALLRSMSCCKAVLASDVPANRQLPDEVLCRIPPVADPVNELETAISRLIDDPLRRQAIGEAAREYVKTHHAPALTCQAYSDAFNSEDLPDMIRTRSRLLKVAALMGEFLSRESASRIAQLLQYRSDIPAHSINKIAVL